MEILGNTVDAAYKNHGYKVQSLIRLKIVWNGQDVTKYIIQNSVRRLTTSFIRLKFRKNMVKNKHIWLKIRNKNVFMLYNVCVYNTFHRISHFSQLSLL